MESIQALLLNPSPAAAVAVGLLKASLLLALAQSIVAAARGLSAAAKHLILTAGMTAFLVMPLFALFGPAWEVAVDGGGGGQAILPVLAAHDPGQAGLPVLHLATPEPQFGVAEAAALLWMLVAFAFLARLAFSAIRLRSILAGAAAPSPRLHALLDEARARLGIDAAVRLVASARVTVPMIWGVRSGTLLLPLAAEEWTDEQLRATFIHELGHLQRLDYVSLALMNLVAALLWFDPQVWAARRRALTEGERACDDLVLRAGERASQYAAHLLHVARSLPQRDALPALLAMSRPSQLEGRMVAILAPSMNRATVGGRVLAGALVAFFALALPLAAVQVAEAPEPPPAPPAPAAAPPAPNPAPVPKAVPAPPAAPAPKPRSAPRLQAVSVVAPVPPVPPVTPVATPPRPPAAPTPAATPTAIVSVAPAAPPAPPVAASEPRPPVAPAARPPVAPAPAARAPLPPAPVAAPAPPAAPREGAHPVPVAAPTPRPAAATAPPAPPAVPVVPQAELGARPYRVLRTIAGRSYTLKLGRPVNTGDPSRNAAESLATTRLLQRAAREKADAVTNFRCYREIGIGFRWPTSVVCQADAIAFDS